MVSTQRRRTHGGGELVSLPDEHFSRPLDEHYAFGLGADVVRVVLEGLEAVVIVVVGPTVRLRQRVTKGAGSRTKALMMAFKLLVMAEERWRKVNGSELLALVRAGVRFVDGVQEKPKNAAGEAKENAA